MCPACLTTLAVIAAGTGTAGGLTAVVAKKLHDRRAAKSRSLESQSLPTLEKDKRKETAK